MVETVMKVIPNKGTRLKGARWLAGFSVLAWVLSILMVKLDWFTVAEATTMLWTTEYMKWGLTASFGIYATSETGIKIGEAVMNANVNTSGQ